VAGAMRLKCDKPGIALEAATRPGWTTIHSAHANAD
jgi:hypothetical protein